MKNAERMRRTEGSPEGLPFLMEIRDIGGGSTNERVKEQAGDGKSVTVHSKPMSVSKTSAVYRVRRPIFGLNNLEV